MSVAAICDGPLSKAMERIGEGWPSDRRSIFIEHRATVICMRALNQLRLSITPAVTPKLTAIGASPSGDPFFLPGIIASLVLYEAGFHDINLGPDTPIDVIIDAVEEEKPRLVWLALGTPLRSRFQIAEIERLLQIATENQAQLVIGGRYGEDVLVDDITRFTAMQPFFEFARQIVAANDPSTNLKP